MTKSISYNDLYHDYNMLKILYYKTSLFYLFIYRNKPSDVANRFITVEHLGNKCSY